MRIRFEYSLNDMRLMNLSISEKAMCHLCAQLLLEVIYLEYLCELLIFFS